MKEPEKTISKTHYLYFSRYEAIDKENLKRFIEESKDNDIEYQDYDTSLSYAEVVENPNYEKELEKYKVEKAAYDAKVAQIEENKKTISARLERLYGKETEMLELLLTKHKI